jgi:hypothetical protein
MNLYDASVGKSLVLPICELQFEDNCSDTIAGRHFISSNLTYVPSGDTTGAKAAWFNGTSSSVVRTNDPAWDYSWRDWMFRAKIRPQTLSREQTLWYHGGNAGNYLRVFLTADGRLALEVVDQGTVRMALQTQPGALFTNQTQSVAAQQTHDRWFLWIGNEIAAANTNLITIQAQDGPLLLGCSPSGAVETTGEHYYGGLMDDVIWVVLGYAQTAAIAETVTFSGGALPVYGHNETYVPSEVWRLAFQAWNESAVNVCVTNLNGGIARLLETGTFEADEYLLSSAWRGTNDFRLRPDSPCVDAAEPAAVLGIPRLRDLAGNPITDDAGNLLIPRLDMGPYESAFDYEMLPFLTIDLLAEGLIRLRVPAEGRMSCLFEATLNGGNWFPIRTNTVPTNGFYECYQSTGRELNTFYRARLTD